MWRTRRKTSGDRTALKKWKTSCQPVEQWTSQWYSRVLCSGRIKSGLIDSRDEGVPRVWQRSDQGKRDL